MKLRKLLTPLLVSGALVGAALVAVSVSGTRAGADEVTASVDTLRTGWDANEPSLTPSSVASPEFGQLFSTPLNGQIYAQPVVAKGVVLVATENDAVYGIDAVTGAVVWSRDVGPAWPAGTVGCGDLVPNIGVTSTPVYDPATGTAYFTAKVASPSASSPTWYMHAVDITTGTERSGFPASIGGSPTNDPTGTFDAETAMQRPGLLLLGGVVYAGFASHCDHKPYVGYVAGVDAATGAQTTLWATESDSAGSEAGIWQSGGGLVSDGPGQIVFATGNGVSPVADPGNVVQSHLAESVVRLNVGGDGNLTQTDFFSPTNDTLLDTNDQDLGSGGPMGIPDGYGTTAHPHLLVQVGKDGRVFLLDRSHLGGDAQGAGGTNDVLQTVGPHNGVWGHPAFFGGGANAGYVYDTENRGNLRAYRVGTAVSGLPSLTSVATTSDTWGYTSGSPVVTSDGSDPSSALVWAVDAGGATGASAQLRAYAAVPTSSTLSLAFEAPIGTASKFSVPATSGGRVYVGTRDGNLFAFGAPTPAPLRGSTTDFGPVAVGATATADVVVTASTAVTVSSVATSVPFAAGAIPLPQSLAAGQTLTVPVRFTPTTAGGVTQSLAFATSAGPVSFGLTGDGTQAGLTASPASLDFGQVPTGGNETLSVNIVNSGTASETITGATAPGAPFGTPSLPVSGSTLAAGASVSVPVTYAPTASGPQSSSLVVSSDAGSVTVPVSGTGITGSARLSLNPTTVDFGSVTVGQSVTKTFTISDTGNLSLTITKAAPPSGAFGTSSPVSEGQQLNPADTIVQSVTFTPTSSGPASGAYEITADDGQGAQQVTLTGTGSNAMAIGDPAAGGWRYNGSATAVSGTTVLTPVAQAKAGDVVYPTAVSSAGIDASFTTTIGGGTGADGMAFALLDASATTPTSLGSSGDGEGVGGLAGVAVSLDTYKAAGEPSNNFVGVTSGSVNGKLIYSVTSTAVPPLRTGSHQWVVTTDGSGTVSITVDGAVVIATHVALPRSVYLAFSAGTGGSTDAHTVSHVSITAQASGPAPPTALIASPTPEAFGAVPINTQSNGSVTLTNPNATTATIAAVTAPSAPFTISELAVGTTIPANGSVTVPVVFSPTSATGYSSSFSVTTSAGTTTVGLTGTGTTSPPPPVALTALPTTVAFGSSPINVAVNQTFRLSNSNSAAATLTSVTTPSGPFTVSGPAVGGAIPGGGSVDVTVGFTPTAATTYSSSVTYTTGAGSTVVELTGSGTSGPTTVTVGDPAAGGWTFNGSAKVVSGASRLTPVAQSQAGDVVYPTVVSSAGITASFTTTIGGGTGADGMSFALLDARATSPSSLGGSGDAEGFGGLAGVAVSLDTYKAAGEPSNNFVGVTSGFVNKKLVCSVTSTAIPPLRTGTHRWVVGTDGSGDLSVSVDGKVALNAHVALPPSVYLAFTAGTGGATDAHTVSNVSITANA